MIGTLELAKALHEARREILEKNGFHFEFEQIAFIDREVLYEQAVVLLNTFDITPKLEVKE